jgi:acetyltransferase
MRRPIRYARDEGLKALQGAVLKEISTMMQMCGELGFEVCCDPEDPALNAVRLDLHSAAVTKLLAGQD